jgi:hypothetical protein
MFIQNKYYNWYYNIIQKAIQQKRSRKQGYFERHHIIPKSLGGNDENQNLVLLTAREHFICHLLLTRMLEGKSKDLMIFACLKLSGGEWYLPEGVVRSRTYERIKKHAAAASSRRMKGIRKSVTHCENLRKAFQNSISHKEAARNNVTKAHELNRGKSRPQHSQFMREHNSLQHNTQYSWTNINTQEHFIGSRIELHSKYPELRLDELWKVTAHKAKSHKGWKLTDLTIQ